MSAPFAMEYETAQHPGVKFRALSSNPWWLDNPETGEQVEAAPQVILIATRDNQAATLIVPAIAWPEADIAALQVELVERLNAQPPAG